MNTQVIGLILLAIIVASNFIDFKSLLNNENKKEEADKFSPEPSIKPVFPTVNKCECVEEACNNSVFCAVRKWEELKKYCEAAGLKTASSKLDEVFPLLVLKEEKNV